jgi:UPF0755 protein
VAALWTPLRGLLSWHFVAIVSTALVLGGSLILWQAQRRYVAPGPLAQATTVVIPKGARLAGIADRLAQAGVVRSAWITMMGARLDGAHVRAGEYLFQPGLSAQAVVTQMVEGRTVIHKLTVAEGLTVRRVMDLLGQADYLAGSVTHVPAEGMILPDTWHLSRDDLRQELVDRMERGMIQTLDQLWAGRAADLPLRTKEEALVLASIVERETAIAAERPHVAQVFENRLRLGMRLQSDPTVIYGLSDGMGVLDRPLTHDDLSARHPWNTYVIDGLPPTPIAIPGRAAIEAVLHPTPGQDLYFVANGGGGHAFAKSLSEHNKNVARWRHLGDQETD